jgi:hypothetical protein
MPATLPTASKSISGCHPAVTSKHKKQFSFMQAPPFTQGILEEGVSITFDALF